MRFQDRNARILGLALFAVTGMWLGSQLGPVRAAGTAGPCPTCSSVTSDANLKYEIGYFTDADQLQLPSDGLYGMVPEARRKKLPAYKQAFCARTENDIAANALKNENQLAFDNPSGWFKSGECWWHTRFTRSALYIANFRTDLPKPSPQEAKKLIRQLILMDQVVEIPGYANISDFSRDYEKQITDDLSRWHLENELGVVPAIEGITGKRELPAPELQGRMDQMYDRMLQKKAVLWAKVPMKMQGLVGSHAILITDMQPLRSKDPANPFRSDGYQLTLIDPNSPHDPYTVDYHWGDTKLKTPPEHATLTDMVDGFIPYVGYDNELADFESDIKDYCR